MRLAKDERNEYLDEQEFTIVATRRELTLVVMAMGTTNPTDFNSMLNSLWYEPQNKHLRVKSTNLDEISPICDQLRDILEV